LEFVRRRSVDSGRPFADILPPVWIIDRIFGAPWSLAKVRRPWGNQVSVYDYVRARLDPNTGRIVSGGDDLPDETDTKGWRWESGALDGVMGHHAGDGDERLRVRQVANAIEDMLELATETNIEHLHRLSRIGTLAIADPVIEALQEMDPAPDRLHALGRALALEAPDRETVKLGILLLGTVVGTDDSDLLMTLGSHDEFTLFVAVAFLRRHEEGLERRLWELAQRVDGWGRISVVERLALTKNSEIRGWMLREGFRNSIMNEYLAYTCATSGDLEAAVAAPDIDDPLFHGASEILLALAARGGPAQSLEDYAPAEAVVTSWIRHVRGRGVDLSSLEVLDALANCGALSTELNGQLEDLRSGESVHDLIQDGLQSRDVVTFRRAVDAARSRGVATFEHHLARFDAPGLGPSAPYHAQELMREVDEARIDALLELIGTRLDLEALSTGPTLDVGIGPDKEPHHVLDSVLSELERFPGRGVRFLLVGLRSPVVRNRGVAVQTLAKWGLGTWTKEIRAALELAARIEPDDEVKARMQSVLSGGPGG
jgi:hypothetical protein